MKNITININTTIRKAMKVLDKTAEKCLLVVDDANVLKGTLTDGDLRRSILTGIKFTGLITDSYNSTPITLQAGNYTKNEAKKLLRDLKIDLIPIVDKKNHVVDYVTWATLGPVSKEIKPLRNVPVVIMAGGKGTRMKPFTNVLPKPLIPIREKPVIEHIIESFTSYGCSDYCLSVNYKSKIMKAYFDDLKPDYNVSFIEEGRPLGTAGSLYLIEKSPVSPFFITNCDIIIKTDYGSLYEFHKDECFDITLVASAKEYIIPYGTCVLNDKGELKDINEKPKYNFLINTGLYIINPDILQLIPQNTFFNFTDLIEKARSDGRKIGVYPIDEDDWIDVGQWKEYKHAIEVM